MGNDNATPEQVQAAYTALANSIAQQMGVSPTEALVLMQNDPQFAGAHSRDTNLLYINDLAHNTAGEAVNTVGHETQHYLDNQQNPNASQSAEYKANRENYADIMGNATEDYLKFNFAQNDYSLAGNNNHSMGKTAEDIVRNATLVAGNQVDFRGEDEQALDYHLHSGQQRTFAQKLDSCQSESCLAETIAEYRDLANQQNGFTPERQQVFDQAAESIYQKLASSCDTAACIEFTRNEMLMISTACGTESCIQERAVVVQKAQQTQQGHWGSLSVDAVLDGLLVAGALFPAAGAGKVVGDALTEINPKITGEAVNSINQGKLSSSLIEGLVNTGVKVTPENVVDIRKLPDGKTVWLETGNASAGLQHIYIRHEVDFINKGIAKADIKTVIMNALELNQVVGTNGSANVYRVMHNGVEQHIAIGVGSNGFVVRANPVSEWKPKK